MDVVEGVQRTNDDSTVSKRSAAEAGYCPILHRCVGRDELVLCLVKAEPECQSSRDMLLMSTGVHISQRDAGRRYVQDEFVQVFCGTSKQAPPPPESDQLSLRTKGSEACSPDQFDERVCRGWLVCGCFPYTPSLRPLILHPQPSTLNPQPHTLNPKPEAQTLNPQPPTPNPKP